MWKNLGKLLEHRALIDSDKPFLLSIEDGRELSYGSFNSEVNRSANLFADIGVQKGDVVSIMVSNRPEFLFAYYGAMKLGAIAGPVNPDLKSPEIEYILRNSEAKIFIIESSNLHKYRAIESELPELDQVVVVDGDDDFLHFQKETARMPSSITPQEVESKDIAEIIYTSGTTGHPKGCLLTHGNFLTIARSIVEWHGFDRNLRLLCFLPLFHIEAQVVSLLLSLYCGGSVALARRFSSSRFWHSVAKYKVTVASVVPTIITILLNVERPPGLDFSSFSRVICSAAPLPVNVMQQWEERYKVPIVEGYGLSETTCYATFNPLIMNKRKPGSAGLALDCNEIAIMDDGLNILGTNQHGEVVVRGANVFVGYHRNPLATDEAFKGGWFHTGDIGYVDDDGFLFIVDRKKDMINRGGQKIFPREVDEVLYSHPSVKDACALGIPDEKYGEEVVAFIELRDGSSVSQQEIIQFCLESLADYKVPKEILFLHEMPRGPSGKLLRRLLREEYMKIKESGRPNGTSSEVPS